MYGMTEEMSDKIQRLIVWSRKESLSTVTGEMMSGKLQREARVERGRYAVEEGCLQAPRGVHAAGARVADVGAPAASVADVCSWGVPLRCERRKGAERVADHLVVTPLVRLKDERHLLSEPEVIVQNRHTRAEVVCVHRV
eukprot:COSAG03_NODE_13194_length_512_cov_126.932203_2_plen_139_part_01